MNRSNDNLRQILGSHELLDSSRNKAIPGVKGSGLDHHFEVEYQNNRYNVPYPSRMLNISIHRNLPGLHE